MQMANHGQILICLNFVEMAPDRCLRTKSPVALLFASFHKEMLNQKTRNQGDSLINEEVY